MADIAAAAIKEPGEKILEVGPGIGTLTQGLLEAGGDVTAVELDSRLVMVQALLLLRPSRWRTVAPVDGECTKPSCGEEYGSSALGV